MTNTLKPHIGNWLLIIAAFALFCLFAFGLSGCKSRQVQKDYSKTVDKTEQSEVISKTETTQDNAKATVQKDVKETTQDNRTFDTEQTTTINYDTLGRVKNAVIVKKSKVQNLSNSEKTDKSKIDFTVNHSKIKNIDSSVTTINDLKNITKNKKIESDFNWLQLCVGAGAFILFFFVGLIIYKRFKKASSPL